MTLAFKKKKINRVNHYRGPVNRIFFTIIFTILFLYAASLLFLLGWAFIQSLRTVDGFSQNPFGWPEWKTAFDNYIGLFKKFRLTSMGEAGDNANPVIYYDYFLKEDVQIYYDCNFFDMLLNSLIYAGGGALIQALVPCVVAYMLVKYNFKFSKILYGVALITYIIPIVGNYPSVIETMKQFGLYNSFLGNFIQKFNFSGMYFFIYYAFFEGISDSYIEAAELDGANQLQILTRVILPQAKTLILTVVVIVFVQYWNDYQTPLLYLPSHPTIAYGVHFITSQKELITLPNGNSFFLRDITPTIAACMSLAIPTLLFFIFFKEKLMSNLSMGGLKE